MLSPYEEAEAVKWYQSMMVRSPSPIERLLMLVRQVAMRLLIKLYFVEISLEIYVTE